MRNKSVAGTLAVTLLAGLCLYNVPGWASKAHRSMEPSSDIPAIRLSDLQSINVADMIKQGAHRENTENYGF